MRDRCFLLRRQRHSVFVNRERNHRCSVPLRHRQYQRRPLLAIFQIDRIDNRPPGNPLQRLFHHVSLCRIHQNRRRNPRRNPFQNRRDVSLLILANNRAAQIQHVRTFVHQLLGQCQNVVIFFPLHQLPEMLNPSSRVHFLGDNQRLRFQVQRDRSVGARSRPHALPIALRRLHAGYRIYDCFQMRGRSSATAAHNSHAVILNEMFVILRQLARSQLVDRVPAFVKGQPSIGKNRNFFRRIQRQIPNRIVHLLRPGRAVQSQDIDIKRFQRSQRRPDLGAQQHRSGFLQCHLHRNWQTLARLPHRFQHAHGRDLRLQQILAGLDQQNIHSALDQRRRLLLIRGCHRIEADVSQRRQLRRRPHRSRHKSWPLFRRKLLRNFPRQLRRLHVDLEHAVGKLKLRQHNARPTKGVGLDNVAAHLEEVGVDLTNNVRPAQHQHFAAILLAPVIVKGGVARLDVGPHRAVVDDDTVFHELEKSGH